MKTYGSAVLTALQAQQKPIDEVSELIKDRRFDAYKQGKDNDEWVDEFWRQMAIMEVQRCRNKLCVNN